MKKIISTLLFVFLICLVHAQWNGSTAVNNVVSNASIATGKNSNVATTDGAGGMFVAWVDSRTSVSQSVYIQRVLSNGSLSFAGEVLVTNAITGVSGSGNKSNLAIESDGVGGAILIWQDARNITTAPANNNNDIYGQRINASGTAIWAAGGVRLTVADNSVSSKISPKLSIVNATEAIILFGDNRGGTSDVYAQKFLLSTGAPQWAADVSVHGSSANTQTSFSVLPDGGNGAFIIWQDPRLATTNSDIFAQRLDNAGALLWGANGTSVCAAANNQLTPLMVSDGGTGIVITWSDNRVAAADGDIYAQRMDATGAAQWTTNGVAICVQTGTNQSNPMIVPGGSGYIIAWSDSRAGISNRNIYANSIDNTGAIQWTTAAVGGVAVCVAAGNQPSSSTQSGMQIVNDGSNGAIIIWDDVRVTGNLDIYGQRLNSTGVAQWATDGVLISNATGNQQGPNVVSDASNNNVIAWRDARGGTTNGELYASKLSLAGVLPLRFIDITATLNNNAVNVVWLTRSEINIDKFFVERSDDGITFYEIGLLNAFGQNSNAYKYVDYKTVNSVVYYRIRSIDNNGVSEYSTVVKLVVKYKNVFVNIYPNPVVDMINISCGNLKVGKYAARIMDTKGAIIMQNNIAVSNTVKLISIKTLSLQAGNYIVQLINDKDEIVTSKLFQKQ